MTLYPIYFTRPPSEDTQLPLKVAIHTLPNGFVAHRHDFLEFSYVLEGTGWEIINGVRYRKQPGSFTFVLPYQVHEIHTDPGSCMKLYNGEFAMSLLLEAGGGGDAGLRGLLTGEDPPLSSHVQLGIEQAAIIRRLLDELHAEFLGNGLWRVPLVKAKLTEVIVQFDRLRRQSSASRQPVSELRGQGAGEKALWNIIQYIHTHYQDELTLSGVCAAFHLSVSHLSELFKKHSGQTFLQVLHDVRIRHACGLLVSTDMSMENIALEVGYGSYKTFSRIFKTRKNHTPSEYRKAHAYSNA